MSDFEAVQGPYGPIVPTTFTESLGKGSVDWTSSNPWGWMFLFPLPAVSGAGPIVLWSGSMKESVAWSRYLGAKNRSERLTPFTLGTKCGIRPVYLRGAVVRSTTATFAARGGGACRITGLSRRVVAFAPSRVPAGPFVPFTVKRACVKKSVTMSNAGPVSSLSLRFQTAAPVRSPRTSIVLAGLARQRRLERRRRRFKRQRRRQAWARVAAWLCASGRSPAAAGSAVPDLSPWAC